MKPISLVLLVAACAAFASGCAVMSTGAEKAAGAVAFVRGDLEAVLDASLQESARATEAAIKTLELNEIASSADALSARYILRNALDRKITITLERTPSDKTALRIRIGAFGDETLSRSIYAEIRDAI